MATNTFGQNVFAFYKNLKAPKLPTGIQAMNPYKSRVTLDLTQQFLDKFYKDNRKRVLVLGINPGRFGGGLTGVNFTTGAALEQYCGIQNGLPKEREISSQFIYTFIEYYGGVKKFYSKFFLSAVCPLGFTKGGINYNYYDDPKLLRATENYIVTTLKQQIALGVSTEAVILFGTGKNLKAFTELNNEHHFFEHIYALEHPRFIIQYKSKQLPAYLEKYLQTFKSALR